MTATSPPGSPTVSVIIPAYDAEATISAALASVAAQSVPPTEVVISDDGSRDRTVAVARAWQDRLPLRVIESSRNLGPAGSRHAAILQSSGTLLALLDADDYWLPDHLEAMLAAHATTDDGLASADVLPWIPGVAVARSPLSQGAPLPAPRDQLRWIITTNRLSVASLFSRARYDAVGGFRLQFRGTEDWDLWIRLIRHGATVVRPPQPTVLYRLRQGSVSSDALLQARLDVLEAVRAEASQAVERGALRAAVRVLEAEASLHEAYAEARAGRTLSARSAGLRAARGTRAVAVRGLAMTVAPVTVARRHDAVHLAPRVWLRRYGG